MQQRVLRLLLGVLLFCGATGLSVPTADAGVTVFSGLASASGGRLSFQSPGAPATDTPIDGGGPIAEAGLDNLGTGHAFAALPYPGEVFIGNASALPGIVAGAPAPPAYPFYAGADASTPEKTVDAGTMHLHATAAPTEAGAQGMAGMVKDSALWAQSEATVQAPAGADIVARAVQRFDGFVMGPVRIAKAVATADVTLTREGTRTRRASFAVDGLSIGGKAVALPSSASVPPQATTADPSAAPSDQAPAEPNPLQPVFDQGGITVTFVPSERTGDGVVTGGLKVTLAGTLPNGAAGTTTFVLGQVAAAIGAGPGEATDAAPESETVGSASPTASAPGPGNASAAVDTPAGSPGTAPDVTGTPVGILRRGHPSAAFGASPTPALEATPSGAGSAGRGAPPASTEVTLAPSPGHSAGPLSARSVASIDRIDRGLYGALALAAVSVLILAQFLRLGGVSSR
jgi:hypothetical protein